MSALVFATSIRASARSLGDIVCCLNDIITYIKDKYSSIVEIANCRVYKVAAEQKARSTYDNILRLVKDPEVADSIRFLREREIVHFQRFGESLRKVQEDMNFKNVYAFNPAIDKNGCR